MDGDRWAAIDPRFRVAPRHLFGPFYSIRVFDEHQHVEVYVPGGMVLTRRSAPRAIQLAIELYSSRRHNGVHEPSRNQVF